MFAIIQGKKYFDMIAGIGGCNQGHVHPKIFKAFV
jgi:acetylornithine/succinyldiaminopimelate/putrescine aminotransferase